MDGYEVAESFFHEGVLHVVYAKDGEFVIESSTSTICSFSYRGKDYLVVEDRNGRYSVQVVGEKKG